AGDNNSGAAYVFVRSGSSWSQQVKLTANDTEAGDYFGRSVAVNGDTAVIGADGEDHGGFYAGSVYVYALYAGLSIDDVTLSEGDSGAAMFNFTISRTHNSGDVSVAYSTVDGSATTTDGDYVAASGTVNFAAGGALTQQVTIQVNGDARFEADETFVVKLSDSINAVLVDDEGAGTIENDDTLGVLFFTASGGDMHVTEGGATDSYDVMLASEPSADVMITLDPDVQTDLGNGAGNSISLTFTDSNWDTEQTVTVTAVDDLIVEGNHSSRIACRTSSNDSDYNSIVVPDTIIDITDNDSIVFIFLPMLVNNDVGAPDLMVKDITIMGNSVQVTIENQGQGPVTDAFWVDLYINPTVPPTQVNHTWETQGGEGTMWGVQADALPLHPGDALILAVGDARDFGGNFSGIIPSGATIYAQVDSAHTQTTYGGVMETHEINGDPYNNIEAITISSTVFMFMGSGEETAVSSPPTFLPSR
ncbi:MAG: hypothetical protein DWQ04_11605, partial [Chloroflexi bacterium]